MKHTSRLLSLVTGAAILSMAAACSSGSGNPTANDDAGNNAGTGGAAAGGAGSTGGSTSVACPTTTLFAFDADQQGFVLDDSVGTAVDTMEDSGKGLPYLNLFAPGDAGVVAKKPELGWSNQLDYIIGNPNPGSVAITAQYSNWNQSVAPQVGGLVDAGGNVIDLTNKVISFHVRITGDGLTPAGNAGGGFAFLKTGSAYVWGQGVWTSIIGVDSWTTLSINTKSPDQKLTGWDPSAPKQLGIQVSSSGGGGSPAAPNVYGVPRNVVIYIDYVTVSCAP